MDWNKYIETFPDRYIQKSKIDEEISDALWSLRTSKMTGTNQSLRILDIGGGKNGTFDESDDDELYLLDPYVTDVPERYSQVNWDDIKGDKFDLVVARGSLNYLIPDELRKIKDFIKQGGIFIGNSFLLPTTIDRTYTINGKVTGVEKSTYEEINMVKIFNENNNGFRYYKPEWKGIIHHELIPYEGDKIQHDFYYYDIYQFISFFKPNEINLKIYGKNSIIIKI